MPRNRFGIARNQNPSYSSISLFLNRNSLSGPREFFIQNVGKCIFLFNIRQEFVTEIVCTMKVDGK